MKNSVLSIVLCLFAANSFANGSSIEEESPDCTLVHPHKEIRYEVYATDSGYKLVFEDESEYSLEENEWSWELFLDEEAAEKQGGWAYFYEPDVQKFWVNRLRMDCDKN